MRQKVKDLKDPDKLKQLFLDVLDKINAIKDLDYVPPSSPPTKSLARLMMCEDSEGTLKLLVRGRSMALRHITRTQRVSLDFILENS